MTETMTTGAWVVELDPSGEDNFDVRGGVFDTEAEARAYADAYRAATGVWASVGQRMSPRRAGEGMSVAVPGATTATEAAPAASLVAVPVADEWTREVTKARIGRLNSVAPLYKKADGTYDFARLEAALGFSLKALKAAKTQHGL